MQNNLKQTFEYLFYGFIVLAMVVAFTPDLRDKAVSMFKSKPYLELKGYTPYQLNVTEFPWSYGMTGFNQFNGDFDKLDYKVYDLLKGKSGICEVYLQSNGTDKYGNADKTFLHIGDINIDELNKFQDWHYWQKESGIRTLLYKHIVQPTADSARVTPEPPTITPTVTSDTTRPISNVVPNVTSRPTYSFSFSDLYATPDNQRDIDVNRYIVNGTIGAVNYNNGVMQIITSDGEAVIVQFYPLEASSYTAERLMIALKEGNKIESVCARAGASTMDLVSAEITSRTRRQRDTTMRTE
ncbi:hypothetical protein [Mucilaginibacter boryungensis]|uniref:Uncharacterized protein n=1 Tax=Mucilaginibacter boryungensis TaxID=768480 RepID=A0ABR9XN83_9SPHI|nr:hypothetical protein [Mucilaginibacter boryungensis]MBE9668720.1 hypothetical protein [Mucilaginibacter boryungensis]